MRGDAVGVGLLALEGGERGLVDGDVGGGAVVASAGVAQGALDSRI